MSRNIQPSRREFLKGAVLTGAAVATGSVMNPSAAAPVGAQSPDKASFETPPAAIPAAQIKETVTADIVIVGAGASGLSAALTAGQAGAKTILLEKNETFTAHGAHNAAIGSKMQKEAGIAIDKDQAVAELVRYSANKANQRLIRMWVDKSAETMDWLVDMAKAGGLKVSIYQWPRPTTIKEDLYREWPSGHVFGSGQAEFLKFLEAGARKAGVDIRYKTPAAQLIRESKGRVTGVVAKNDKGEYVQFNAKNAVILTTGDYGNDAEMMARYCSWAVGLPNAYLPNKGNSGDGHKMGMWVGGVLDPTPHAPMIHNRGGYNVEVPFLHVNTLGERYENEDVCNEYTANGGALQPGKVYWTLFDSKWMEYAPKMGAGLGRVIEVTDATRTAFEAAIKAGTVLKADTIEALADLMKVPAAALKATVTRYTELAKQGKDLDFGKRADRLNPVDTAPFYASKATPALMVTLGGLKVNLNLQVLDADGKVIPGLYAAGNVSGGFYATDYPVALPGLSHGRCLCFGRVAAQAAVKDKA